MVNLYKDVHKKQGGEKPNVAALELIKVALLCEPEAIRVALSLKLMMHMNMMQGIGHRSTIRPKARVTPDVARNVVRLRHNVCYYGGYCCCGKFAAQTSLVRQ